MSETVSLDKLLRVELTLSELGQLHQVLLFNGENAGDELSERIFETVTASRFKETSPWSEREKLQTAEAQEVYAKASGEMIRFEIPARYRSACVRALSRGWRGQFANAASWVSRVVDLDEKVCKDLWKRLKATEELNPSLPDHLLTPEAREALAGAGSADDVAEALGI